MNKFFKKKRGNQLEEKKSAQKNPKLIVMLTYNDLTVENAFEIFDGCKNSRAEFFGAKEKSLPFG